MKALKRSGFCAAMFLTAIILIQFFCPVKAFAKTNFTLKPESGSDITTDLQTAFNMARDNPKGKYVITIPKGNYKIGKTVYIYSNTTLRMNGATLTRAASEDFTMLRVGILGDIDQAGGYSGFKNITLEGGTWDGNKTDGGIMRAAHGQNLTLKNVTFKNVKDSHHIEMAACKKVTVTGCTFSDFYGIRGSHQNIEALQFDIMHNEGHFSNYGKFDDTPCKNIKVTGCTFKNLQRGLGTHSGVAGSYFTNAVFSNNTFSNIEGYAIVLTNYRSARISRNKIINCGCGIAFRPMIQNYNNYYPPLAGKAKIIKDSKTQITGNIISLKYSGYQNVAFGISVYGEYLTGVSGTNKVPAGDYRAYGLTVKGNSVSLPCLGYGIWLQGTASSQVSGNIISCNILNKANGGGLGDGIRMQDSPGNKILGNKVTNIKTSVANQMCGILLAGNCPKTLVQGNTVSGAAKYGIGIREQSEGTLIKSNKVMNSGIYGIGVWCAGTTIQGNTVSGSGSKNLGISSTVAQKVKNISNTLL